jgi:hypothetical protein
METKTNYTSPLFGGEQMVNEILANAIISVCNEEKKVNCNNDTSSPSSTSSSSVLNTSSGSNGEYLVNHKFTSNASTSSIHNDLKLILEESKGNKQQQQQQQQQTNNLNEELKRVILSPKPQRSNFSTQKTKQNKNSHNKSASSTSSLTSSPSSPSLSPSQMFVGQNANELQLIDDILKRTMKNSNSQKCNRYSKVI